MQLSLVSHYYFLTVSCVLRRTILLNRRSYYTNNVRDSFPKRIQHMHLLLYYAAHLNHNHTIVVHNKLTVQIILLYRLIVEQGFLRERGKHI